MFTQRPKSFKNSPDTKSLKNNGNINAQIIKHKQMQSAQ